jgi:hypothetical protein
MHVLKYSSNIMKKLLYALCALVLLQISTPLNAQVDKNLPRQYSAEDYLLILKNNALLVRLPNNQLKKEALEKSGATNELKELIRETELERKDIRLAFLQTYTFGKIYFYEDYDYKAIQTGNLSGVLTDFEGNIIQDGQLPDQYLVGSFGSTDQMNLDAFIVMDKNFVLLDSPFPYYQRTHYFLSLLTYSKAEVIEKWNERLFLHYTAWFGDGIL